MTCARCGGLLQEDRQFTRDMREYSLPQRRSMCVMGHTVYAGLGSIPALKISMGAPVQLPRTIPRRERPCAQCGDLFSGIKRQKYCGSVCMRAADTERNRRRNYTGKRLAPDELRQARAMPKPWNSWKREAPPVAYAPRPKNLSKVWM